MCARYICNKLNYVNKKVFLIGQHLKKGTLNKQAIKNTINTITSVGVVGWEKAEDVLCCMYFKK